MSKHCCKWHDRLPETYQDEYMAFGDECGLAGMGRPVICCRNCPQYAWFVEQRGIPPEGIDYVAEIMELPPEKRP